MRKLVTTTVPAIFLAWYQMPPVYVPQYTSPPPVYTPPVYSSPLTNECTGGPCMWNRPGAGIYNPNPPASGGLNNPTLQYISQMQHPGY